jgi:hypothetical protein
MRDFLASGNAEPVRLLHLQHERSLTFMTSMNNHLHDALNTCSGPAAGGMATRVVRESGRTFGEDGAA